MVPVSNSNSEKGAHVRGKSLLFDPFKAFVESSHRSDFSEKKLIFLHTYASISGLLSICKNRGGGGRVTLMC